MSQSESEPLTIREIAQKHKRKRAIEAMSFAERKDIQRRCNKMNRILDPSARMSLRDWVSHYYTFVNHTGCDVQLRIVDNMNNQYEELADGESHFGVYFCEKYQLVKKEGKWVIGGGRSFEVRTDDIPFTEFVFREADKVVLRIKDGKIIPRFLLNVKDVVYKPPDWKRSVTESTSTPQSSSSTDKDRHGCAIM